MSKSTRSARDRHGLFRAVARVAARSRSPSIQKRSELKPPNISERQTSNLSDSSRRDCPFFPPSWISSEVCSGCHTRHADAGFYPLSAARRTDVLVLSFSLLTKVDLACLPARLVATEAEDRLSFRAQSRRHVSGKPAIAEQSRFSRDSTARLPPPHSAVH